jgi:electron transport complex protein RnfD
VRNLSNTLKSGEVWVNELRLQDPVIDGGWAASGAMALKLSDIGTLLLGQHGGMIGETCAIALIAGGIYLVVRGVIKPTIPVCYAGSLFLFTLLFTGFNFTTAVLSVFSGGLMLGAIFMATDYVTSPMTGKGRVIFAVGCGFLTACIRLFASSAEGVSFAILLMNLFVPYINDGTRTKPLGGVDA